MGWDVRLQEIPFWVRILASDSGAKEYVRREQGAFFWSLAHPDSFLIKNSPFRKLPQDGLGAGRIGIRKTE